MQKGLRGLQEQATGANENCPIGLFDRPICGFKDRVTHLFFFIIMNTKRASAKRALRAGRICVLKDGWPSGGPPGAPPGEGWTYRGIPNGIPCIVTVAKGRKNKNVRDGKCVAFSNTPREGPPEGHVSRKLIRVSGSLRRAPLQTCSPCPPF